LGELGREKKVNRDWGEKISGGYTVPKFAKEKKRAKPTEKSKTPKRREYFGIQSGG